MKSEMTATFIAPMITAERASANVRTSSSSIVAETPGASAKGGFNVSWKP